jgi:chromosome segregation protein
LFFTRERITALDNEIRSVESRLTSLQEQEEAARRDIQTEESASTAKREELEAVEAEINRLMEQGIQAKSELSRLRDLIQVNEERIAELRQLSERDQSNADEARARLAEHTNNRDEETKRHESTIANRNAMEKELAAAVERLQQDEKAVQDASRQITQLRTEQIDLESRQAHLQNELNEIDAREKQNDLRRARLGAELSEANRLREDYEFRQGDMTQRLTELQSAVDKATQELEQAKTGKTDKAGAVARCRNDLNQKQPEAAGIEAKINLLQASRDEQEGFPEGARRILNRDPALPFSDQDLIGPLAELVRAEAGYQRALETILRPLVDAIVVRNDETMTSLISKIEANGFGSARLVSLRDSGEAAPQAPAGCDLLVNHLEVSGELRPLVNRLFGSVVVVGESDTLPASPDPRFIYLTRGGALATAGRGEFWNANDQASSPLARHHLLATWGEELTRIKSDIAQAQQQLALLQQEEHDIDRIIEERRGALDAVRHQLSIAQGEHQVIGKEQHQVVQRVETISYEIEQLAAQHSTGDNRRAGIQENLDQNRNRQAEVRTSLGTLTHQLRDLESARNTSQGDATEKRVLYSELKQSAEYIGSRVEQLNNRIKELESVIDERTRGFNSSQERIASLTAGISGAQEKLNPVEANINDLSAQLEEARQRKDALHREFATAEQALKEKRTLLEDLQRKRNQLDIEIAQQKMRRQNTIERVTGDYRITTDEVLTAAEPTWEEGGRPENDALEISIAEMRAKLEAMGPVNLVAIEEHAELEERFQFLTAQQTDLVNSKAQLIDMIKQINATTTELFSTTFNKVNENFQGMFAQLFGGGSAKLVLIDEGDVLESGIEIIARPPGKKLQTVSLLSGGERTMTAVALLFSLYMVKPSPFCVLDELDAALDDANIGRFVSTVKGFVNESQFVVITHNRQTIAASRAIYGVTMEKQGISKIISVKFADYEKDETPAAAG